MGKKMITLVLGIGIVTIFFVFVGLFILWRHCARPVYNAHRQERILQNKTELVTHHNAERFSCTTHDGIELQGFIVRRPSARRIIVACHGYSRSKEFMLPVVRMFPNDTILLFDFRAHGESAGNRVSFSIRESGDIHAVIGYIMSQNDLKALPIFGIGVSMGAASLIKAAAENAPFTALVVDSSFAELTEQLYRSWKHKTSLPQFLSHIILYAHECVSDVPFSRASIHTYIQGVTIPLLIVHADKDWLVPVEDALHLYNAAQSHKRLWIVPSCRHACNFDENPAEYKQRIDEFFDSVTL